MCTCQSCEARGIEDAIAAYTTEPPTDESLRTIARLCAWRAELSEDGEPWSAALTHWERAVSAAADANDVELEFDAWYHLGAGHLQAAHFEKVFDIVDRVLSQPSIAADRFMVLRGQCHLARGHFEKARQDIGRILAKCESELHKSGALVRLNRLATGSDDRPSRHERDQLLRYGALASEMARVLQATNRLADAEPLMRRALAIDEQSYGPDHPHVAIDLNNLAALLQATNRLADAEPLSRRVCRAWHRTGEVEVLLPGVRRAEG